ncbi:MAG: uroporphyrinogen decarboxylase family protein [Planctomycetota bacterium]
MTSKEIVRKALRGQRPPRLPVFMGSLGVDDRAWIPTKSPASFKPRTEGADEWGCVWRHTDVPNMGQVAVHPLEDIRKLDKHPVPDYSDQTRYVDVPAALQKYEAEGRYVVAGIFMVLFERMHTLHGFENTLVDLYEDRPAMAALADRIVEVHVALVREVARRFPGRIDGWSMTDDWGTQQAAFISYDLWMDFFCARYKRIFDAMHEAGCDVWVHSCGKVNDIIEGYVRAGADAVNLQQPRALGIETIGQRYRGRITLESLADIQVTLPSGDKQKIEADAEALMTHWASPAGGFVFSDYGDDKAIGVQDASVKSFMYDAFSKWSERVYGAPLPQRT